MYDQSVTLTTALSSANRNNPPSASANFPDFKEEPFTEYVVLVRLRNSNTVTYFNSRRETQPVPVTATFIGAGAVMFQVNATRAANGYTGTMLSYKEMQPNEVDFASTVSLTIGTAQTTGADAYINGTVNWEASVRIWKTRQLNRAAFTF